MRSRATVSVARDSNPARILLLYMFPSVLFLTPLYKVFNTLKLIGSNLALVIAYCTFTIPFGIWLLVSYIDEIPREIDEAGMIDGANVFQIIIRLLFPLLCPDWSPQAAIFSSILGMSIFMQ